MDKILVLYNLENLNKYCVQYQHNFLIFQEGLTWRTIYAKHIDHCHFRCQHLLKFANSEYDEKV